MTGAKPFLKWAGGKGQLIPWISELLPAKIRTYYEPFIGGGAVFWNLAAKRGYERAVVNDWNQELVDTYTVVRDNASALIAALNDHQTHAWNTEAYFKEIRKQDPKELSIVARAARMIYLNKTCYNGLYRVNKSGGFNSPFGRYKNPGLFESNNLRACADALKRDVTILQGDFSAAVADAGPGDVVYFDPPYVPVSDTADFTSYTAEDFGEPDQARLALTFRKLAENDVSCVLSNSDAPLIRKLFEGFEIVPIQVKRNINSKGDGRGHVTEVLVVHRGLAHRLSPQKFDYSVLGE